MKHRAALPRNVKHSDTLERLIRLRRDFAVLPFGADNEKFQSHSIKRRKAENAQEEHQRLMREADNSIKGVNFPAEEMAKVIRSWMRQDEM
jgi:hypothetical protein